MEVGELWAATCSEVLFDCWLFGGCMRHLHEEVVFDEGAWMSLVGSSELYSV